MNKLYLNVPLRAAAGSYINFMWKKRFFMIATKDNYNCNNTGDYDGNDMAMIKKMMMIMMMMMIIFHSRRNYVCFNPF